MNMACPLLGDYWKVFVKTKDDTISEIRLSEDMALYAQED